LYTSTNDIRLIRLMRLMRYEAQMGEMRFSYKLVFGEAEEKRGIEKRGFKWENNIVTRIRV
jgi:hypothetical protein